MTERYGWDQTPTPDLGLDISKAPEDIQNLYKWIIEKMYGEDVASAYGQAMVLTGILAKNAEAMSLFTSGKMDVLTTYVDDMLIEMTDKDIISAPEIIASRDGATTLSDRLDRDFGTINYKMALLEDHVSYDMFGVNGEPKYYNESTGHYYLDPEFSILYEVDDGVLIREAHEYANSSGKKIVNKSGHYVIRSRNIPVKYDCDFGNSVFHVDESDIPTSNSQLFRISSNNSMNSVPVDLVSSIDAKYLHEGSKIIPNLSDYSGCLMFVFDDDTLVGKRSGVGGYSLSDMFVVYSGGTLSHPLSFSFNKFTRIQFIKLDDDILHFGGGTFLLNGKFNYVNNSGEYKNSGVLINRSKVKIHNQSVSFEGIEESSANSNGFYVPTQVFNFVLDRVNVDPRKNMGIGGTYGIGGNQVLDYTISNVVGVADDDRWGIMGTNRIKNMSVVQSDLNRVDVHFQGYDVSIRDSIIGGIRLSGGGNLTISDTDIYDYQVVSFRDDYGSKWDGNITVENVRLVIPSASIYNPSILSFSTSDLDYGYPIVYGRHIRLENILVDYASVISNAKPCLLISTSSTTSTNNIPIQFPNRILAKDISSVNGGPGIRLLSIQSPHLLRTGLSSTYSVSDYSMDYQCNAVWEFINIDTRKIEYNPDSTSSSAHIHLGNATSLSTFITNSIIPEIIIRDCSPINISLWGSANVLRLTNCRIAMYDLEQSGIGRTKATVQDCVFELDYLSGGTLAATQPGRGDYAYINCRCNPPIVDGVVRTDVGSGLFGHNPSNNDIWLITGKMVGCDLDKSYEDYWISRYEVDTTGYLKVQRLIELLKIKTVRHRGSYIIPSQT